ncbi:hypothetical protein PV328_003370 [Microctonus aethiopoides]|uniref:Uncharacterized protein n=1 Tax=Microctonus aethiopoides TaxID=144406 RepID=A0AA39F8I8_9HYME|nr:hypothetical protein PV328_003370 [Microctonus aethiopoides]KAK0164795.1 hypothetical protein PV328_003370 [Microctonus aethiopoides]
MRSNIKEDLVRSLKRAHDRWNLLADALAHCFPIVMNMNSDLTSDELKAFGEVFALLREAEEDMYNMKEQLRQMEAQEDLDGFEMV